VNSSGILTPVFLQAINRVDPFYRAPDAAPEGAGLGPSAVKRIIDACKGRISIESEPGRGTRVEIRMLLVSKAAS